MILPSLSVDLETDTFLPFLSVTVMFVTFVLIYPPLPRLPPPPPEDEPPPDDLTGSVTLPFASVVPVFSVVLSLIVTDTPLTALFSLSVTVTVV